MAISVQDDKEIGNGSTKISLRSGPKLVAAAAVAGSVFLIVIIFPFTDVIELKTRDVRTVITGGADAVAPLVIVAIDDISFERINIRWPWPREILAEAVASLTGAGARVIGLDIMMGDNGYIMDEDTSLQEAIAEAGNVILPSKFDRRFQNETQIDYYDVPLPKFEAVARSVGFVNLIIDRDGYVRRIVPSDTTTGITRYAFALEILGAYSGDGVPLTGDFELPTSADNSVLINYARPRAFRTIPFYQVVDGIVDPEVFRNAIVLIGAFFKESHDLFSTPFETTSGLYGVEIHANIINTIYSGEYLIDTRRGVDLAILVGVVILGALILVRLRPVLGLLVASLVFALYGAVAAFLLFRHQIIMDMIEPMLAVALLWVGSILYRYLVVEKQRRKVRATFSRFVSREVVDTILDSGRVIELGGETREVTIFFSDIFDFTPISESMTPAEIVEMLNEYFTGMTDIIFRSGGTVNKYIGDAIMAFYGAPVPLPDASARAVRACLEMREAMVLFNEARERYDIPAIRIGMGLHKGQVLVGNIGSPRQMEYTVIGDAVNVGSRIEGLTRELSTDFLISEAVYQDVKNLITAQTFSPVDIKGKSEKIVVHGVTGLRGDSDS